MDHLQFCAFGARCVCRNKSESFSAFKYIKFATSPEKNIEKSEQFSHVCCNYVIS